LGTRMEGFPTNCTFKTVLAGAAATVGVAFTGAVVETGLDGAHPAKDVANITITTIRKHDLMHVLDMSILFIQVIVFMGK
jgi:hypothetical protein